MLDDTLDLEQADFGAAGGGPRACVSCASPIGSVYYTVGDQVLCQPCQLQLASSQPAGSGLTRFVAATALGLVAAALGAGLWYAVTKLTGYEIGLIAIAVGFIVGAGVAMGSQQRGGIPYQLLAVVLSYGAICATYVPDIMTAIETQAADASADGAPEGTPPAEPFSFSDLESTAEYAAWAVILMSIAVSVPFLGGIQNVIGLLIIGFALWQAWTMNRKRQLTIEGPFDVGTAPG